MEDKVKNELHLQKYFLQKNCSNFNYVNLFNGILTY